MANNDEMKDIESQDDEQPVLALIQALKDGRTDPKTLSKELRQQCVEVFMGEGYSVANMAQVLKRSEKTVKRDISEIRERNALNPDVNLAKQIIGEYLWAVRIHRNYLMRLARGKDGSVGEKAQAEYYAYLVSADNISKLQSLGYLPSAPQAVVGEIFHRHSAENDSDEDIKREISELEKILNVEGEDDNVFKLRLDTIKNDAKMLELRKQALAIQGKGDEAHGKVD